MEVKNKKPNRKPPAGTEADKRTATDGSNGHRVDVGLDVHKHSWNAAVFLDGVYIRNIHQPPITLAD